MSGLPGKLREELMKEYEVLLVKQNQLRIDLKEFSRTKKNMRKAQKAFGALLSARIMLLPEEERLCTMPECTQGHLTSGYCKEHYYLFVVKPKRR